MPYLIGTDEAGYGPNLGPLVISLSVWWVEDDPQQVDLAERLNEVIVAGRPSSPGDQRVAIADSKQLYGGGRGLDVLERGVLSALSVADRCPRSWRALWSALGADEELDRDQLPWYRDFDLPLPAATDGDLLEETADELRDGLRRRNVRLEAIRSVAVFPGRFNDLVAQHGNKATALSRVTLALLDEALRSLPDEPILICCDKHGGRKRYGPLLQQQFPDYLVEIIDERPRESVYRWGPPRRRVQAHFKAGGESFLPAALASMTSKYLREMAMRALNHFWCDRVDGLRPTAGYPLDARRFKAEIADVQQGLARQGMNVADHVLWRCR
jgi:ribonuclease HII